MKTVSSQQSAVSSQRSAARVRRFLSPVFCFLLLLPTAHCLLPTAFAAGVWTRQRSNALGWLHAVYFLDENRGWAVGGGGIVLATTDGGKEWRVHSRPTEDALRDVYFSDEQNGWLVCERSIYNLKTNDEPLTFLLRTTDGGVTWTRVNVIGAEPNVRLVRALFTEGGRGWVFGEAGALYATRDGGVSWEKLRVPTRYLLLGGSFLDGARGWLVGAGATLLQTADGGESWRTGTLTGLEPVTKSDKAAARRVRFTSVSFVDAHHGWAVGAEGRVFATRDGGRTWAAQKSNVTADLADVKFLDKYEGWAVGAEGTLIHTTDGGALWTAEASGTTHALERLFFVGRTRGWAVGFGGTIISYAPNATRQSPGLKNK
jgi:photosystem II stability/assembly factor-like uncharacterized protein